MKPYTFTVDEAEVQDLRRRLAQTRWPGRLPGVSGWVRRFYRDLFAGTGGVPVPDERNGGASINHADVDLADPEWNTSAVPWSTIYYEGGYPRLQQVKSRWDPLDVFHHALSVRPA